MLQLLNKKNKLGNKGFSLVELIIVIAIMAVLVAILLPQYLQYVEKSKMSADSQSVDTITNAIKTMLSDDAFTGSTDFTITWAQATNSVTASDATSATDLTAIETALETSLGQKFTTNAFTQQVKANAHKGKTYTWKVTYDATTKQPSLATTDWT